MATTIGPGPALPRRMGSWFARNRAALLALVSLAAVVGVERGRERERSAPRSRPGTHPPGPRLLPDRPTTTAPDLGVTRQSGVRFPAPRPSARPRRRARAQAWLSRHRTSILILTVVLTAVGVVHGWGLIHSPLPRDDEGTYMAQAFAVQKWHRLAHYTYIYDHPPLGWTFIAMWTWVTGAFDRVGTVILAGREFVLVCQLASCALLYALVRRLSFTRVFATAAVVLFSFAPLALKYHRFVYLDNIAQPWLLAAFVLALTPRRHLGAAVGSAVCFAVGVLIKETTLLFLPPLAYLLWQRADHRTRRLWLSLWGTVFVLSVALYASLAMLRGELSPGTGHVSLLGSAWWQLTGRQSGGSIFHAGTVNNLQVASWLRDDSVLMLYALLVLPTAFFVRSLRPFAVGLILLLALVLRGGYLPIDFPIGALWLAAILVAGVGNAAWPGLRRAWRRGAPGSGLVARGGKRVVAVVAAFAIAAGVGGVGATWVNADAAMLRDTEADHSFAAERWTVAHLPHDSRIVVEDVFWTDLVRAGWDPEKVIWHEKIDGDPDVHRRIPGGWRGVDYVISSSGLRSRVKAGVMPTLAKALQHSKVVASFGGGDGVIEIRHIEP